MIAVAVRDMAALEYGETMIVGMRVPSPKKSSGWT